ncbi:helix-turn-helix domain-containing protein [Amycolatopsis australiensis]|uniref:Helix-turn-helix n=1 Tax=Amycolatopsis australiensis TaxID=546364 RepID=A0A1K1QU19_9PSEU|nr:helix-turn-helix domain-containing protein [Amycolatopsis australiensis]SFW63368.1 Helix-turn-helix [Amycolatopsis australiensis]
MDQSPTSPLAFNLRRLRKARGLTVVDLARTSRTARATLTQLEAGTGNPTLETLYALANALGVPLADLIAERPPAPPSRVTRRGEGVRVAGKSVEAWLLDRTPAAEIYDFTLTTSEIQQSEPHPPGTWEHLHLHTGRIRTGPAESPIELGPGDYAAFAADVAHVYERIGTARVTGTLIITRESP